MSFARWQRWKAVTTPPGPVRPMAHFSRSREWLLTDTGHDIPPSLKNDENLPSPRRNLSHLTVLASCLAFLLFLACLSVGQAPTWIWLDGSAGSSIRCDSSQELKSTFYSCLERYFDASSLRNVTDIGPPELLQRRDNLAQTLQDHSIDAFVVEPGFTFLYYANLSQPDWEPWEPEERPFLMVIMPEVRHDVVTARTIFLVPSFEVQRALLSNIPCIRRSEILQWEEEQDPFLTLAAHLEEHLKKPPNATHVIADEELRYFIVKGIEDTGIRVTAPNIPVLNVRERKSSAEIAILRAANTATIAGLASAQKCIVPGLTEQVVETSLNDLYKNHGLTPFFNVVLFEENAALPHGGSTATRKLARDDFVLIDVGVHLYHYSSDVTRTFMMATALSCKESSPSCPGRNETVFQEKIDAWDTVLEAQKAAISMMRPTNTAASVDLAARKIIDDAGYEGKFTHRLGHGIGIKAHESPYLNRGNIARRLDQGMCFTAEPGVYIDGVFGVRHEDVILVTDDEPELLTAGLARSPWCL